MPWQFSAFLACDPHEPKWLLIEDDFSQGWNTTLQMRCLTLGLLWSQQTCSKFLSTQQKMEVMSLPVNSHLGLCFPVVSCQFPSYSGQKAFWPLPIQRKETNSAGISEKQNRIHSILAGFVILGCTRDRSLGFSLLLQLKLWIGWQVVIKGRYSWGYIFRLERVTVIKYSINLWKLNIYKPFFLCQKIKFPCTEWITGVISIDQNACLHFVISCTYTNKITVLPRSDTLQDVVKVEAAYCSGHVCKCYISIQIIIKKLWFFWHNVKVFSVQLTLSSVFSN